MLKILKESIDITNNYLVIATPLIIFSLISSIYLIFSFGENAGNIMFTAFLFFLMLSAFLSGWFYMITKAVKYPNSDKNDKLIAEFPAGVGEYFLIIVSMLIISLIISAIVIIAAVIIGKKCIGYPDITQQQLLSATLNIETMKTFVNSLSAEQLYKLNKWNFLIFFAFMFNYFILMFYNPVIFFKNKNPVRAFIISIKDLFGRNFFKNFAIFCTILIIYTLLSIISVLLGNNLFLHFLLTLANFYFLTFAAIYLFNYYYSNFVKIGTIVDKTV